MELGEGEAQICRLCGQYESIYIDVFSEEGTKRLLGLKIHSKINILIKENDGLPHVVCLRCIGALEFLCDFYSCCQHTQTKLSLSEEASKYLAESTPRRIQQHENDAESDKENVLPSSNNETKRRSKVSSPSKKDRAMNDLRPDAQTIFQGNALDDRSEQSATNNGIVQEQKSTDQQCNDNVLTRGNPISTRDISKKGIARASGSGFLNSFVFPMKKGEASDRVDSTKPNRRGKGRRTQLQKLREAGVTLNRTRESRRGSDESERDGNQRKRQCLRTICTNGASNVTKNAVILSKPQIELPSENKIATISSNKSYIKNDNANDNDLIGGGTAEVNLKDERLNEEGGKEESSAKSKAISVIVKQEKVDVEAISHEPGKTNQFVWIPNEILTEGQNDPTIDQDQEIELDLTLRLSPGLEDDMENSDVADADADADADAVTAHTDSDNRDDSKQPKTNPSFVEQTRATVIKSSREGPAPVAVKPDVTNDIERIDGIVEGTENDSKCDLQFPPRGLVGRDSSSSEESKNKDRSFAKISELISEEQKEEIETYYKIDMSIVNSKEVEKNLTVVDKKNIRCNICGSLYLRMDKCQVHIWGHLQMKPFQCKACDFATVTVSNVRCHIRKSHLKIKPFACDLCGKRYVTAGLLEQHINGHTGARPFKCKICDFASSTRQMLSYHSSTHKPIKDINCKICGKEFYSRGKLRTHMIVHKKDKVFVCKLCSAHLSNAEALETHHKNLHTQDYVCNVCGKRMKSKKALNNHQNVHSTGKYKCSLCTNVYKSSQILKEHLLKHEGIRKYKCSVCGKTFGQQSHLAAHMAVHSGIRFHCPGCDKSFNRHDNMKIHTKRCKQFLANPQLKNLLVKKERSWSIGKVTKSTEDTTSKDSSSLNFESLFEKQTDNEESSIKTVDEKQEETAMKLGLNISCIESPDKTWTRDNVYREEEIRDLTGSGEFGAIQITETNDTFNFENDNVRILEIL